MTQDEVNSANVESGQLHLALGPETGLDDPRVLEAVQIYLEALEAGNPPDREQFLARFAEIAKPLAGCIATLELVHHAAPNLPIQDLISSLPTFQLHPEGPLGDFRIIREVGRGGMGVVYEAVQISLGRRVALKVLPFGATMDPRHLLRFQNEARAAASLEHPHIVPVFGVGCERGVHYYAMKFIDGQSLAQVVDEITNAKKTNHSDTEKKHDANHRVTEDTEKNQITAVSSLCSLCLSGSKDFYRSVAELGIQAALALEYAHSMGIIHRDIKPANLLIETNSPLAPGGRGAGGEGATDHCPLIIDPAPGANATRLASIDSPLATHPSSLRLWVTDFGLARTAADPGLTMTGDILGTLRYMSPEQALAKHGLVDHRTDIYSLGVTLYELLTGFPAVVGKDREQILNAITLDEPRSPRALDPAIPRDLETIVLKAIAKGPTDRYSTARELAEDLQHFLDDK
ncbi:MAG TPA: serine/threonine-protein kinase, partial [Gemmataceae bacterium]|nr:serine/threonine-protein kinase [Gemmataceae bacterium]